MRMPPVRHVAIPAHDPRNPNATELIEVEELTPGLWRVLCPPRFGYGLATGDEFELRPDGKLNVTRRSGNLLLRFFSEDVDGLRAAATPVVKRLGGVVEGCPPKMLIATVPVSAGWKEIEAGMAEVTGAVEKSEVEFGNVYDPLTGKQLNWWHSAPPAAPVG